MEFRGGLMSQTRFQVSKVVSDLGLFREIRVILGSDRGFFTIFSSFDSGLKI